MLTLVGMRAVAAAMVLLCGCSFLSAKGPPEHPTAGETPRCNPGKGGVYVDATIATIAAIVAIAAGTQDGSAGVGIGLFGAVYAGSAFYGSNSANRCRKALAGYDEAREEKLPWEAEEEPEAAAEPEAEPEPEPSTTTTTSTSTLTKSEAEGEWADFWVEVDR